MLVFLQSNRVSSTYAYAFCRHICSCFFVYLYVPCQCRVCSTPLRVGVKALNNKQQSVAHVTACRTAQASLATEFCYGTGRLPRKGKAGQFLTIKLFSRFVFLLIVMQSPKVSFLFKAGNVRVSRYLHFEFHKKTKRYI